jgi:CheY-like chemotaxis protein
MTDAQRRRVLVIDDCVVARAEMLHRLSRAGFHVTELSSPIGATRVVMDEAVHVVVIDIQMPSMRGDRLAALFKANPRFASVGVVLVTGAADTEIARLAASARADAVLSKSQLSRLPDVVTNVCQRLRAAQPGIVRSLRPTRE